MRKIIVFQFSVLFLFCAKPSLYAQCSCSSIGFENNSVGCWDLKNGTFHGEETFVWLNSTNTESQQHVITDLGDFDAIANCVGDNYLPQVAPGSTHSLKIGDADGGKRTSSAAVSFTVDQSTTLFQLQYAVVFRDPGHSIDDQPRFEVIVGTECGDYFVVADESIPGFQSCNNGWRVKPWTTVGLDLSSYIGQQVTLEFISADCALGAHGGYAYIDASCVELDITIGNYCPSDASITLSAPDGFSQYIWTNQNTGQSSQGKEITIQDPQGGETYQVEIVSVTGCSAFLDYTLPPLPSNSEIIIEYIGEDKFCAGNSGRINVIGSSIDGISLNGVMQTGTNFELSPLSTTSYSVIATSSDDCINDAIYNFTIEVYPAPAINLMSNAQVVCPGEMVTLSYVESSNTNYEWVGLGINNTPSIDVLVDQTTTFSVVATSSNGCEVTDEITIYVIEEGEISYDLDVIYVCPPGSPTNISVSVDNVSSITWSYLTYLSAGNISDTLFNHSTLNGSFTLYPEQDMMIPVTFTSENACIEINDLVFIDVIDEYPSIEGEDRQYTICTGDTLSMEFNGDFDTLSCDPPPLEITANRVLVAPSQNVSYNIRGLRNNCTPAEVEVLVTVEERPTYTVDKDSLFICEGNPVILSINLGNNNTINWLHNGSTEASTEVSPTTNSFFVFEVSSNSSCTAKDSIYVGILRNEDIEYDIDTISICKGTYASLGVESTENISIFWPTLNETATNVTVSPEISTAYEVIITSESGCTQKTDYVFVHVDTGIVKLNPVPDLLLCPSDSALVTITGENVGLIHWEQVDTIASQLVLPIDTFDSFTVRGLPVDNSSCPSPPVTFKIDLIAPPNVSIETDLDTICINDEVTLTVVTNDDAPKFYWTDTRDSNSIREVLTLPSGNNIYSILVMDENGCENSFSIDLGEFTVLTPPTYSAKDAIICLGETAVIDLAPTNHGNIYWHNSIGNLGQGFSYTGLTDTVFTFDIYDQSNCLFITDSIRIGVNPSSYSLADSIAICTGESIILPFPELGVDSLWWQELDTVVQGDLSLTPQSSISLHVTAFNSNGCVADNLVEITVFDADQFSFPIDNHNLCIGDSLILGVPSAPDWNVTWYDENGTTLATTDTIVVSPTSSTLYIIEAESRYACTLTDTTKVHTIIPDVPYLNDKTYTLCEGEELDINLDCSRFFNVEWSLGQTGCNVSLSITDTGFYPFTYTDTFSCIQIEDSIYVEILPYTDIFPEFLEACLGESTTILFPVEGVDSIFWQELDTLVYGDFLIKQPSNSILTATIYRTNNCITQDTIEIIVIEPTDLLVPIDTVDLCIGDSLILEVSSGLDITWYYTNGDFIADGSQLMVSPETSTTFAIQAESPSGCILKDSVYINVLIPIVPTLENTSYTLCEGENLTVDLDCSLFYNVEWETGIIDCNTPLTLSESGYYTLKYTDAFSCIQAEDSIYVEVIPTPYVLFEDETLCLRLLEKVKPDSVCNGCILTWQDGSSSEEYIIQRETNSNYLSLTARNQCGEASDTVFVSYNSCKIYTPNGFSPNQDGINDKWNVHFGCDHNSIQNYQLKIFNRWGRELFSSNNLEDGWAGRNEPQGVYVWHISFYDPICKKNIIDKGNIHLIR